MCFNTWRPYIKVGHLWLGIVSPIASLYDGDGNVMYCKPVAWSYGWLKGTHKKTWSWYTSMMKHKIINVYKIPQIRYIYSFVPKCSLFGMQAITSTSWENCHICGTLKPLAITLIVLREKSVTNACTTLLCLQLSYVDTITGSPESQWCTEVLDAWKNPECFHPIQVKY